MKWELKIQQVLQYHETLIARFDSLATAESFLSMVMTHCDGIKNITITAILPEEEETEE